MSAAQQRNWLLAATLAVTAILVLVGTPSRRVGANDPPVIRKVKAKADASPQPVVLEGRVAPAVTVAIPVPAERLRLVAKVNELVAAGAVVGTTPGDAGSLTSIAVRAPMRGILVASARGRLGIASDPSKLSAHALVTAGDLPRVRPGQQAEIAVKG